MTQEFWYLSRAAGFTAYLLLFVSVALGIGVGTRLGDRIAKRNTIFDLHRFTTILALAFTLFHVYILLLDGFFNFSVWQLSLPFLSPYRRWQTAVGVFAMYAFALIVISFYVRRFIGYRAWRAIHFVTFAMFAGVALHGITAGTDTAEPWAKLIYVATGAATLALILYRIQHHVPATATVRTVRLAAGIAAVSVVSLLFLSTGLLSDGGAPANATANSGGAGARPFLGAFTDGLTGSYTQTRDTSGTQLVITGTVAGDVAARLRIELAQSATSAQQQPVVTRNVVELRDETTDVVLCTGALTALQNGVMRATCEGSGPYSGVRISIASSLQTDNAGTISGTIDGTMARLG